MVEADIQLKLLPKSILDSYKNGSGIWVHPYIITLVKFTQDMGIQGHLWSNNDAIGSWLRLKSTSDTLIIHIKYIQSVWATGVLYQGHLDAPLCRYTGQVGPRYGNSASLVVKWKWCHYVIFEADIHLSPVHTSILDIQSVWAIGMLSQGHLSSPL